MTSHAKEEYVTIKTLDNDIEQELVKPAKPEYKKPKCVGEITFPGIFSYFDKTANYYIADGEIHPYASDNISKKLKTNSSQESELEKTIRKQLKGTGFEDLPINLQEFLEGQYKILGDVTGNCTLLVGMGIGMGAASAAYAMLELVTIGFGTSIVGVMLYAITSLNQKSVKNELAKRYPNSKTLREYEEEIIESEEK